MDDILLVSRPHPAVALLTLNRPQQHNALDATLIAALSAALVALVSDDTCRVVMLTGAGRSFCAGADLNAMLALGGGPAAANVADADALAQLLQLLRTLPRPTVAVVNGTTLGGGVGLVAACDIAIASDKSRFGFPEVRLGIAPAVISPHVCAAIGVREARRLFLTGESFEAVEACRLGLVHRSVAADDLQSEALRVATTLLEGGPQACAAVKRLLDHVAVTDPGQELARWTAEFLAGLRAGEEAQHGLTAALSRVAPRWKR